MEKKNKVYLIILGSLLILIILYNIINKKESFDNKTFKKYLSDNNFNKSNEVYIGSDNSFKSFYDNTNFDSLIKINTHDREINASLSNDKESMEIIYNIFSNKISLVYQNFSNDENIVLDKFEGNYDKKTISCESVLNTEITYCEKIKVFSNDFKNYFDNLIRK